MLTDLETVATEAPSLRTGHSDTGERTDLLRLPRRAAMARAKSARDARGSGRNDGAVLEESARGATSSVSAFLKTISDALPV